MADDSSASGNFPREMTVQPKAAVDIAPQTAEEQIGEIAVEGSITLTCINPKSTKDQSVATDIIPQTAVVPGAVIDNNTQSVDEPGAETNITVQTVEGLSAVRDISPETVKEMKAVTDIAPQIEEETKAVRYISSQTVEEMNVVTDTSPQTLEERNVVTDISPQTLEERNVVTDISPQTLEENVVTDISPQTVEENVVTDTSPQTVEEMNVVTDTSPQTVEEMNVVTDTSPQTVEEMNVVTDTSLQTVEEMNVVTDIATQTVEVKAVTDISPQTIEETSAVVDIVSQTVQEVSAVTGIAPQTAEEPGSVTDISSDTTGETVVVMDIAAETVEQSAAVNIDRQMTEEKKDGEDAGETIELLSAIRDNALKTLKEPIVVRDLAQRKFGYVKISWNIENFFFVTENEDWEISSPVFDVEGFYVTKWRLILKVKKNIEGNNRDAYICLERLDGENDTRNVRVCWNVWYKIAGVEFPLCEQENLIRNNCLLAVPIKNCELFITSLQSSLQTNICVGGLVLVRSPENGEVFKSSEDLGVKRLSEDISIVYSISQHQSDVIQYESFSDLKINTDGYTLISHKPILSARSKALNDVIHKHSGKSDIDFNISNGKAGKKIFKYLYSGNLAHILRMPSISIDKAINYLSMDELKCYYLKDSIHLLTQFEAEEMYFKWIITDLKSSENFLFSPIFSREKSGLALRLRLGLYNKFPRATCLSLKLDVIEGNNIPEFYFMSGIANNNGQIVNRRAMKWIPDCKAEILNFTSKSVLANSTITGNGNLTIFCSIFIPKGKTGQKVVKTQKCLRPELDYERHYRLLSIQLSTLFETGKYSDFLLICNNETFKVHRCVLFARSPVLRRAFRKMEQEGTHSKGFYMHDFKPKILLIILRYIYSGILNCEREDILAVYEGSKKLSMVTLQNQLYGMLLNNLEVSNAIGTLELAVKYADFRLVEPVCQFMKNNLNEIRLQDNWEEFLREKEHLYERLKQHAINVWKCLNASKVPTS